MSYSNSKTWVNPQRRDQQIRKALNDARNKLCPRSDIWFKDFDQGDLDVHKIEWKKLREKFVAQHRLLNIPAVPLSREAFSNKTINGSDFIEHYSTVICEKTVFTPYFKSAMEFLEPWPVVDGYFLMPRPKIAKAIAPWPRRDEMKYEGDERVVTELIHARCLALPRVSGNETVNWQHRAMILPSYLDNHTYVPCRAEVLERSLEIGDLEDFSDMDRKTPREILGYELWKLLDPIDRI